MVSTDKEDRKKLLKLILGHFFHFQFMFLSVLVIGIVFVPTVLSIYSLSTEGKISTYAINIFSFFVISFSNTKLILVFIASIALFNIFYFGLFALLLVKKKVAWHLIKMLHSNGFRISFAKYSAQKVIYNPRVLRFLGLQGREYETYYEIWKEGRNELDKS